MSGGGSVVLRLVAVALCIAAFAAIVSIVSGDFSEGDLKVIGTSVLFAVAASTGGAGATLRLRGGEVDVALGTIVLAASIAAFAMVTYGIWAEGDSEGFWRTAGVLAIVAVDGAHASFVLARQRPADPPAARTATVITVLASAISATLGVLAVTGAAQGDNWELLAVVLVIQLLGTALAPVLRRLDPVRQPEHDVLAPGSAAGIPGELRAIADALDAAAPPGAVRDQAERLRNLARRPELR